MSAGESIYQRHNGLRPVYHLTVVDAVAFKSSLPLILDTLTDPDKRENTILLFVVSSPDVNLANLQHMHIVALLRLTLLIQRSM